MKTALYEVLNQAEVERIHTASMEILAEVGMKVNYKKARDLFREAGADVNEETLAVRLPEQLVRWAVERVPKQFSLYGIEAEFRLDIGPDQAAPVFAGLGTPTRIIDLETGAVRSTLYEDMVDHIILIDACQHIHNSQMDIWPIDIPMNTIQTEAIWAWTQHSRKPYGMGCSGYLPTWDIMRMMSIAVGGKQELQKRPRFLANCSVVSPLQIDQAQAEGLLICAEYGQPVACTPEAVAGITAPVTLAGLLVQENAAVLAHITLAQIFRPGAPVLYGTASTTPNMRNGTVTLGSMETGLITAASAQMARYYGLPIRSVGGTTDSKREDLQAGFERMGTLLPAVLAGVNLIACAGTLDSAMLESHALLMLDDEICGATLRLARGIEVSDESLALDLVKHVGYSGSYVSARETSLLFRKEFFMPTLLSREPYEIWQQEGGRLAIERAHERVLGILAKHQPREVEPALARELNAFKEDVAARNPEEFHLYETEEKQDFSAL